MKTTVTKLSNWYQQIKFRQTAIQMRKQNIFQATIYLDQNQTKNKKLSQCRVSIFGQFTSMSPWKEYIPMNWDENFKCMKATVWIKIGEQFKFIVNEGSEYLLSSRYDIIYDEKGNANNIFKFK